MNRLLVLAGLLTVSMSLFALNCGHLAIRITNNTGYTCQLQNKTLFYGMLVNGFAPMTIPSGSTTDDFYMTQDSIGNGIQLGYQCGTKHVKFYSYQEYCYITAGDVGGVADLWNELTMTNRPVKGNYWAGLPGRISWEIIE